MKRKIIGWIAIISSTIIIILATLSIVQFGDLRFVIGIPVGIYIIIKYLPDARRRARL